MSNGRTGRCAQASIGRATFLVVEPRRLRQRCMSRKLGQQPPDGRLDRIHDRTLRRPQIFGGSSLARARHPRDELADFCAELGVRGSMGSVGTSADNAAAESFNASLKRETLQGARRYDGARTCWLAVFRWITRCNTRRRHSAAGQLAPIDYEHISANMAIAA